MYGNYNQNNYNSNNMNPNINNNMNQNQNVYSYPTNNSYDSNTNTNYNLNNNNSYNDVYYEPNKNKKNFPVKKLIIVIGIILLIFIIGFIIFLVFKNVVKTTSKKEKTTPSLDESIYNIYIEGEELNPSFSGDIYDYYLLTDKNSLEIKCDLGKDSAGVEGCNKKISLDNKTYYVHNVISKTGVSYNFYIKVKENENETLTTIDSIEGLDKYSDTEIEITVKATNTSSPLYYSIDNGVTFQESNIFKINKNGRYYLVVKDKYDNMTPTKEIEINNILSNVDSALYISSSSSSEVTLKDISTSELEYSWNGGSFSKNNTYKVTSPGTFRVVEKDKSGRSFDKTIVVKNSDFTNKKRYSVTIYNNGNNISDNYLVCTDNGSGCVVTLPEISKDGYDVVGYSTDKDGKKIKYSSGEKITLTKDIKLYANTKKNVTVTFDSNGNSISTNNLSCTKYNDSYCLVDAPKITSSGSKIIGWNTDKTLVTALYTEGSKIKVYEDMTLYALSYTPLEVSFDDNGADEIGTTKINCKYLTGSEGCKIVMPSITRKDSNILGWDINQDNKTAAYKVSDSIFVKENLKYYAITRKDVTISFEANGAKISKNTVKCSYYNKEKNCNIVTPNISRNYATIYGFDTSKDSHTASIKANSTISVDKNMNYYAITSKTVVASFISNGASSISSSSDSCTYYNSSTSCNIITPSITRSGWKVVGWGTSNKATKKVVDVDSSYSVKDSMNLYAITSKSVKVTFKTYSADNLFGCSTVESGGCSSTCTIYNTNSSCSVTPPYIASRGNEVQLFSTSTDTNSKSGYVPGIPMNVKSNLTLYAIVRNDYRKSTFSIKSTKTLGHVVIETESGCGNMVSDNYNNYVTRFYNKAPYVFTASKMNFVGSTNYIKTWGSDSAGMTYGRSVGYRGIDIQCPSSYSDYYLKTIVHEMTHAWDSYFYAKTGQYLSGKSDVQALLNKYKKSSKKPLRDYSYSSQFEFVADMYAWYYFIYIDPTYQPAVVRSNTYYPSDMKKVMEKYISIAKNGYK